MVVQYCSTAEGTTSLSYSRDPFFTSFLHHQRCIILFSSPVSDPPPCFATMNTFFPIQEAQEMREDDDLKRATELSLQGWNKDSEYFVCNLKGFKIMALRISDNYLLLAVRWWSRLETHLFKMAYPLWLTLFYIIYLLIFNILLYCICFIFITCPWVLRKALKNKMYHFIIMVGQHNGVTYLRCHWSLQQSSLCHFFQW